MLTTLGLAVAGLALASAFGLVVVAWAPEAHRGVLFTGLPVLGVMLVVIALSWTTWFTGVEIGLPVIAGLALVSLIYRSVRVRWWTSIGGSWRWLLLGLLAGALPLVVVALTAPAIGPRPFAQPPTTAGDIYSYVSTEQWLVGHSATQWPNMWPGGDTPAYGYVAFHLRNALRIGQELWGAAVAVTTGRETATVAFPVTALSLLMLPCATMLGLGLLGVRRLWGLIGGLLAATSFVVTWQFVVANSDAMLGAAMTMPALAAACAVIDGRRPGIRPPRLLAAGALAAWLGTYTELLIVMAAGLAGFTLARRPRDLWRSVRSGLLLIAVSVVLSPFIWYTAYRYVRFLLGAGSPAFASPFLTPTAFAGLTHVLGVVPYTGRVSRLDELVAAAFFLIAVGLAVVAVVLSPVRRFIGWLIVSALLVVLVLSRTGGYSQYRAVCAALPSLLAFAAVGGGELWTWLHGRFAGRAVVHRTVAALLIVAVAAFVAINIRATRHDVLPFASATGVGSDFEQAVGWMNEVATAQDPVIVVADNGFDQTWLMYATRDNRNIAYPFDHWEYSGVVPLWFADWKPHRYMLVDKVTIGFADPATVVHSNDRFELIDMSRGHAAFTVGVEGFNLTDASTHPITDWMRDNGKLLLVTSPGTNCLSAGMWANPYVGTETVDVQTTRGDNAAVPPSYGRTTTDVILRQEIVVSPQPGPVILDVVPGMSEVTLVNQLPARPVTPGTQVFGSVQIQGISPCPGMENG